MASTQDNMNALNDIYARAISSRLCASKKEFADMVGVSRQAISAAINGDPNYATDAIVVKATRALDGALASISMRNSGNSHGNTQKNFASDAEDIKHVVDRLVDEMAKQRESYERLLTMALQNGKN